MECPTVSPAEALLGAFPFAAAVVSLRREVVAANTLFEDQIGGGAGFGWLTALERQGRTDAVRAALRRLVEHAEEQGATIRFPDGPGARWRLHLRRYRQGTDEQILVVFEPALDGEPLRARLHDLEARVHELRKMKHEVSNPLMGLVGNAELLASDPSLGPEPRRKVGTILEQARRMCKQVAAANHPVD